MGSVFFTALSGLHANSSAIDMTANNLANLNTAGYKSQRASFSDLFADAMAVPGVNAALGTARPALVPQFIQGALQTGQGGLDAAIADNGNGFFVTQGASGLVYTRAGLFQAGSDTSGNNVLLSQSGNVVQGYPVDATGQTSATPGDIVLPTKNVPAATSAVTVQANLDAATPAGGVTSYSQTIDDAHGVTHTLTVNFTRGETPGNWTLTAAVDGKATGDSAALQFDSNGNLVSPPSFNINAGGQTIAMPLFNSTGSGLLTQYSSPSALGLFSQNGRAASDVTGYSIADGGLVMARCSDGSTMYVARLALAQIENPSCMKDLGDGDWVATPDTMKPVSGNTLTLGMQVVGSALERSTADTAAQLTNLIVYQRAYEASSKAIVTNDQMLQQLYQLVT